MSELGERLLRVAILGLVPDEDPHVIADAQGEIEDLRAEIERLRAALTKIANIMPGDKFRENEPASIAHAALKGQQG